jgi:hypothetical protein
MPTTYTACGYCGKQYGKRLTTRYCCPECKAEGTAIRARENALKRYYNGDAWRPVPFKATWINPNPWKGKHKDDFIYGNMVFL